MNLSFIICVKGKTKPTGSIMERLTTAQWEKMEECVKGLAPEILNISDPSAFISAVLRFMMAMQQQRAAAAAANGGSNSTGK